MATIYISIGSNIEPETHLCNAVAQLRQCFTDVQCSPVYRSAAIGFAGNDFLNLVVKLQTTLSITDVQQTLHAIEDANGRRREGEKFGSRTLDLDLLLYDTLVYQTDSIQLPRDEITAHACVLKPLVDLAPELTHPALNKSMQQLWQAFPQASQPLELTELVC